MSGAGEQATLATMFRHRGAHVLGLGAFLVGAFLVAVAIERFTGVLASPSEIGLAALFVPLTSIVGSRTVLGTAVIGVSFWPVVAWLGLRWVRHGPRLWEAAALGLWLMLGSAQPVTRLGLIMSA